MSNISNSTAEHSSLVPCMVTRESEYDLSWTIDEDVALCELYDSQPIPLDRLPYTAELDTIWRVFNRRTKKGVGKHHLYCRLMGLRKSEDLAKKGRAKVLPQWWD